MIAALPKNSRRQVRDWIDASIAAESAETIAARAMRVNRFDVLSSLFAALIWFLGILVSVMFLLWCLAHVATPREKPVPPDVKFLGAAAAGGEPDFQQPDGPEIENLTEPDLTEVVAQIERASTQVAGNPVSGDGGQVATGVFSGPDVAPPGDPDGEDIVPRWERWQLLFNTTSQENYADQLDGFGIELGVFGGGVGGIDYVGSLSGNLAVRNTTKPEQERRLYFSWREANKLIRYEQNLLRAAGVSLAERNVVKFIPADLENKLATLELTYAAENSVQDVKQIAKTVFESRARDDDGYEFVVIKQRYRKQRYRKP